jgi:Ca2+-binding EF-hand superfamily protein
MKKTLVIGCLLGLCGGSVAFAHHGAGLGGRFGHLDSDGDGKVTLAEMQKVANDFFGKLDANHDGRVTKEEATAFHDQMRDKHSGQRGEWMATHLAEKDADKDGRLSAAEVPRMPAERFARIDTNKDGFLSKDELAAKATAMQEHFGKRFEQRGADMFARADGNKDGAIDAKEADAEVAQRFAGLDANHDGVVVADEMQHGHGDCAAHEHGHGHDHASEGKAGSGAER